MWVSLCAGEEYVGRRGGLKEEIIIIVVVGGLLDRTLDVLVRTGAQERSGGCNLTKSSRKRRQRDWWSDVIREQW